MHKIILSLQPNGNKLANLFIYFVLLLKFLV